MVVLGSAFLLREIELAHARAKRMSVDERKRIVTLHLPISKTDPTAIRCSRSWGCVCCDDLLFRDKAVPCPYHHALSHVHSLCRHFHVDSTNWPEDVPLFPTVDMRTVYEEAVVATIDAFACKLGHELGHPLATGRSEVTRSGCQTPNGSR
jgi:hypothetical protein